MMVAGRTWLFVLSLFLWACSAAPPAEPVAPIDTGGDEHPADQVAAARHLPTGLPLVVLTDDFHGFLEQAGRGELIARFRKEYEETVFSLVRSVGYNVLSPEALADLGIDVNGQAGAAMLVHRGPQPTTILFFTLSHAERFKNLAYMIANGHVGRKRMSLTVGDEGVMVGRNDLAMLVFDRVGMVVVGNNARGVGKKLLRLEPEESLARERSFRVAMRTHGDRGDVRGYFDLRAALYSQVSMDPRFAGKTLEATRANIEAARRSVLAGARARGATPERLVEIDTYYQRAHDRLRDEKFQRRMRALFGGIEGGGFSASVSSRALEVSATLDIEQDALLAKLLRTRSTPQPLLSGLTVLPAGAVGLSLDLPTVLAVARAFNAPIAEANILIGADIETDLFPLLTGGVAAYVNPPAAGLATVDRWQDLQGGLLIGVADASKVDEVLSRFTDRGDDSSALKKDGPRRWRLVIEDYPPLTVALDDHHLIISTDPELPARVAQKGSGPAANTKAWQLVSQKANGAELFVSAALAAALSMDVRAQEAPRPLKRLPWHHPKVQKSEAYAAKLAALNAADQELWQVRAAAAKRAKTSAIHGALSLGALGLAVRVTDDGLALDGSFRTTGRSVASILAAIAKRDEGAQAPEDRAKLATLQAKRKALQKELDAVYATDAQANPPPEPEPATDDAAKPGDSATSGKTGKPGKTAKPGKAAPPKP